MIDRDVLQARLDRAQRIRRGSIEAVDKRIVESGGGMGRATTAWAFDSPEWVLALAMGVGVVTGDLDDLRNGKQLVDVDLANDLEVLAQLALEWLIAVRTKIDDDDYRPAMCTVCGLGFAIRERGEVVTDTGWAHTACLPSKGAR